MLRMRNTEGEERRKANPITVKFDPVRDEVKERQSFSQSHRRSCRQTMEIPLVMLVVVKMFIDGL